MTVPIPSEFLAEDSETSSHSVPCCAVSSARDTARTETVSPLRALIRRIGVRRYEKGRVRTINELAPCIS